MYCVVPYVFQLGNQDATAQQLESLFGDNEAMLSMVDGGNNNRAVVVQVM